MTCGVYLITNRVNGHRYVGKAIDIEKRLLHHAAVGFSRSDCPALYRAVRKHGWENFDHSILEACASDAAAREREVYWIAKLGTFGAPNYNLTMGGDGTAGRIHSRAARAKMSQAFVRNPSRIARATEIATSPETIAKKAAGYARYLADPVARKNTASKQSATLLANRTHNRFTIEQELDSLGRKLNGETRGSIAASLGCSPGTLDGALRRLLSRCLSAPLAIAFQSLGEAIASRHQAMPVQLQLFAA